MFTKLTRNNRITLPKRAADALGRPSHVQVDVQDGRLLLTTARPGGAAIRRKLARLGIRDTDIADAVTWARSGS